MSTVNALPLPQAPDYIVEASQSSRDSQNSKLPKYHTTIHQEVTKGTVCKIFEHVGKKLVFKTIEKDASSITAVYRKELSFGKLLSCCFRTSSEDEYLTAIKLLVYVDEEHSLLGVQLKGLYGVAT